MLNFAKKGKRLFSLLIGLLMIANLFGVAAPTEVYADTHDHSIVEDNVLLDQEPLRATKAADDLTVLAFSSDVHNTSDNQAANRIGTVTDIILNEYGKIDAFGMCGDMGGASLGESEFWTCSKSVMDVVANKGITGVYTTGNHEFYNGKFDTTTNSVKNRYKLEEEGMVGDNFIIYCLGTDNWSGNSDNYPTSQINKMKTDLAAYGTDKPIIVLCHFPLHAASGSGGGWGGMSRSTTNADLVIDALNEAAARGQKIVLLWGHNHTVSDEMYDQIFDPGSSITYKSGSSKQINFYYGAAGCGSDSEYGSGSAYVKGKALCLTINNKDQLSFTYYDARGNNVTEGGTFTEQDPVLATGITLSDSAITLEQGRSKTLSVTAYTPADTNKYGVTWSSSNPSVATVDANTGRVKAVASTGTAVITATYAHNSSVKATCTVNVTPRTTAEVHYVIKIGNYAMSNERSTDEYTGSSSSYPWGGGSSSYKGLQAVTLTNAAQADDSTRWIIEESDDGNGYYIKDLDGNYLSATYESSGGSYFGGNTNANLMVGDTVDVWVLDSGIDLDSWEVDGSYLMSTNAQRYLCEETGKNGTHLFTVRSKDNADETTLEQAGDPVAVTGISVSPATASVDERKSITLTATITPADATNKNVIWTSSNTGIATVDANGRVRGVSEGTVTITATAEDGGAHASATVTVNHSDDPVVTSYVIVIDNYALSVDRSPNQAQGGSSSYTYNGLAGVAYDGAADDSIRWVFEETTGGYYIKSLDGKYLNATYELGSNSGHGDVRLDDTPDVWVLDSGYSIESGKVDGSRLKSTNATSTSDKDKYLSYENDQNLFTVRSLDNSDTVTIEEAEDPTPVTGVSVNPTSATVEARKTVQLTATVLPNEATNKKVNWTSSNTSVATVDANGLVRGVAEGNATITATTVDGNKTATVNITVTAATSTSTRFELTDSIKDGGEYLIVSTNAVGSAYALTNPGGTSGGATMGRTAVEILSGNYIETEAEDIVWTATAKTGGFALTNGSDYLEGKSGNVNIFNSQQYPERPWNYTGNQLQHSGGQNTYTVYYSGSAFTSSYNSNTNKVYLFEKVDVTPVAVNSVTVTPATATVEAKRTVQLTANISPSNATNKKVTWTSSNTDVATVDANGLVRGVAAGTATITATTADGGKTSSATITVTPSTSTEKHYIIMIGNYAMTTDASSDKLTNAGSGSQSYNYTGLASTTYKQGDNAPDNILWIFEETEGGYYIKSLDGRYLNATYGQNSTSGYDGVLKLDNTKDVWVIKDGSHELDDLVDGSRLKSTNASNGQSSDKCLAEETGSANTHFFTIRSDSNADDTSIVDEPSTPVTVTYTFVNFTWTGDDTSGYTAAAANYSGSDGSTKTVSANLTVSGTDPTCTAEGTKTYTASVDAGISPDKNAHTDEKNVTFAATGHNYGEPEWTWTGYTAATAKFTCSKCGSTETKAATISSKTEGLTTTYTATVQFNGSTYTDSKSVTDEPVTYTFVGFIWTGDDTTGYTAAEARYTVSTGGTETVAATVTHETTPASCESNGKTVYTAIVTAQASLDEAEHTANKTVTIPATGHEYGEPVWTWTGNDSTGYTAAFATFTCANNAAHKESVDATLTTQTTDPTCVKPGKTVYTATIIFNNKTYNDTREQNLAAQGHSWNEGVITKEPTCQEKGLKTFTCTVCGQTRTEDLPIIDHNYGELIPEKAATCAEAGMKAHYECSMCGKLFDEEKNETTETALSIPMTKHVLVKTDAKAATCEEDGNLAYWTCENCGKIFKGSAGTTEYASIEETVIPALGHNWKFTEEEWVESEDGLKLNVCYECQNDSSHTDKVAVTVTAVSEDATCTQGGHVKYTGSISAEDALDGVARDFETETFGQPLGHSFGEPTYTWTDTRAEGGKQVTAERICTRCGEKEIETVGTTAEVTKPATCTEKGETTYTTAAFTNKAFKEQTLTLEDVEALGHDLVHHDAKAPTCTEAGWEAYDTCSRCDYTTKVDLPAAEHQAAEAVKENEVPATCTKVGGYDMVTYCSVCNAELSRVHTELPMIAHTPAEAVKENEVLATCTRVGGYDMVIYCSVCNAELSRVHTELPMTDHTPAEAVKENVVEATCTTAGHYDSVVKCSECGHEISRKTVEVPMLSHELKKIEAKAATCEEGGNTEYWTCENCHKFYGDAAGTNEIAENSWKTDAQGHKLVKTEAADPTCEEDGNTEYWTCSTCKKLFADAEGKTQIELADTVVEATGHDWVLDGAPTWSGSKAKGYTAVFCYTCANDETHTATMDATIKKTVVKPTCAKAGSITYNASITAANSLDGKKHSFNKKVTGDPATGVHTYGDWVVTKAAKNVGSGILTHTCTVCGAEETKLIQPLLAKGVSSTATKVTITWKPVDGAERYQVLFATCDAKNMSVVKTVTATEGKTSYTYSKTDLTKNTYYRFQVRAQMKIGGKWKTISTSYSGHFISGNQNAKKTITNMKSITLSATTASVKVGKTFDIAAKLTPKANPALTTAKKMLGTDHCAQFRYTSMDSSIAKVSTDGVITGVSAGKVTVYIIGTNGLYKAITVTVK